MAEFIVAIELGSSKIMGIAGTKTQDGSINVLSVVKEDASEFIRKGVVYNIDKTGQSLTRIIHKLKKQLKQEITQVYVGVGGQSIRSVKNVLRKELPEDSIITMEMVTELMDCNRGMDYQDQEIIDAATQEYKVDNQLVIEPVGVKGTLLESTFLNIIWRKSFYDNLNNCFQKEGIAIAEMYLAPLALADSVLTENEKRNGCVLVDLGADTTTVTIYYKSILRHLAVLPIGGENITKDIASLRIDEQEAESLKLKYAKAITDGETIDHNQTYTIDSERTIDSRTFIEVVEARVLEIIENVVHQVPIELQSKLIGGYILTGGGSNMKNIEAAFLNNSKVDKVRIANKVVHNIITKNEDIKANNGTMNTILGLLAKGDINCAGKEINPDQQLFDDQNTTSSLNNDNAQPSRKSGENKQGVVQTAVEKEKAEAERRRIEEERKRQEEEEERLRLEEEERKKNGFWNKLKKKIKNFGDDIMSAEE